MSFGYLVHYLFLNFGIGCMKLCWFLALAVASKNFLILGLFRPYFNIRGGSGYTHQSGEEVGVGHHSAGSR